MESKCIKEQKVKDGKERIEKMGMMAKKITDGICSGTMNATQSVAGRIGKQLAKNKSVVEDDGE